MKTITVGLLLLLIMSNFAEGRAEAPADDVVFRAMQDELDRSLRELRIPGMDPPYFLSYRVRENQRATLEARFTAVTDSSTARSRELLIDLRVGEADLDNSNFHRDWRSIWVSPGRLVDEDSYGVLRHEIWLQTDGMYKAALENLAGKKAHLQANPPKKRLADFGPADPFVAVDPAVPPMADRLAASRCVRLVADGLAEGLDLQDWRVTWNGQSTCQWYLNSEGSKHRKTAAGSTFEVSATLQAADGQRLTGFISHLRDPEDDLPPAAELLEEARRMTADLHAIASAPLLDEYVGPVLFTDYASAQFISQLFAGQLTLVRKPIATEEWMNERLPVGKLATRLKRRILPSFVNIQDQPRLERWGGRKLMGAARVDDEGVACQDIVLVEKGRLVNLPLGRQPVEGLERSNGHARSTSQQMTFPGITNLLVTTSDPRPPKKMLDSLRELCRNQEIAYGLLVRRLDDPRFSDLYRTTERTEESGPELLAAPLLAYRVYAADGRIEPVRGLGFDEASVRSLRDVAALGDDSRVYNLMQPVPGIGGYYPVSIITPSILVEEMELKSAGVREPFTVEKNPLFR